MTDSVHCAKCGEQIHEPSDRKPEHRKPCPVCGSTSRKIDVSMKATLVTRAGLGYKARHSGAKKPYAEGLSGDDLHRKSGKWMKKERLIDREKDNYKEVITDPETGQVVHRCEEPLSKHVGHGSAKKKKP